MDGPSLQASVKVEGAVSGQSSQHDEKRKGELELSGDVHATLLHIMAEGSARSRDISNLQMVPESAPISLLGAAWFEPLRRCVNMLVVPKQELLRQL